MIHLFHDDICDMTGYLQGGVGVAAANNLTPAQYLASG